MKESIIKQDVAKEKDITFATLVRLMNQKNHRKKRTS
jgi:hypothetical protein